jgi:hypothetical protein
VWRDASFAERVVQLAEYFQEWASDSQIWEHAGYSRTEVELWAMWPACASTIAAIPSLRRWMTITPSGPLRASPLER